MIAGTLEIQMSASLARLSDDMNKARGMVGGAMKNIESAVASAKSMLASLGIGLSVASIIAFGKSVVDAAEEANQAQLKLQAIYKATGGVVGFTADELNRMADAMAETTHFDDESIRNGLSEIIKFGSVTGQVFKDVPQVIADFATFSGQAFPEAASAIAKALADPEAAAKLLKQAGVVLTESQKDLIKEMKAVGDEAGAQRVIMERLKGTYSGMEETMNSGLTGATKSLSKEWNELLETFGKSSHAAAIAANAMSGVAAMIKRGRESIDEANTAHRNSILFSGGKGAPLQLGVHPDTGPLAGKTIADVQAANAAIAAAQQAADEAAAIKAAALMKKLSAAAKKQNEEDDKYVIEKAKKEYADGEKQTIDLLNQQQERFIALGQAADDAAATDAEREQMRIGRQLADLERQRMIMATDHELTLGEVASFEQAKLNIERAAAASKQQAGKAAFIQDLATLGKESAAFMTLYKVAAVAEIMAAGGVRAEKSAAWAATWGGPYAAAAAFAISWAATLTNAAMVSGLAGGGGGAGSGMPAGSGAGGGTPTYPFAPEPITVAAKPGIIVSINLGDDDNAPGAVYVRKFIAALNEQIRDGATIDQIRVT